MVYVFYIRGEVCVTEEGVAQCDTEAEAREFVSRLTAIGDSWMMIRGKMLGSSNMTPTHYSETKDV